MSARRSYRRIAVKELDLEALVDRAIELGADGAWVGADISKSEIVVVVRWSNGEFERPWSVKNPEELMVLVSLLCRLRSVGGRLQVAMESTGTYGEAFRFAATEAGLDVHRVSGKAVQDYAEIFDGVPSQHDGKDAAMIAELGAIGKATPWPYRARTETEQRLAHQVARLDAYAKQRQMWQGRLEGLLARHWPELTGLLALGSPTLLQMLSEYGGPAGVATDPQSGGRLRAWSRGRLAPPKIEAVLESARHSRGMPMSESEQSWLREVAGEAYAAFRTVQECEQALGELAASHELIERLKPVGTTTMCVLYNAVGDPHEYLCSSAYVKAFGLNLKELSSGKRKGELAITKRGPSAARRWLYFAALRAVQREGVREWYQKKVSRDQTHGRMKALVAVMRKLCRAIWHVARTGETFDWEKLFPGAPLPAPPPDQKTRKKKEAAPRRRAPAPLL